MAFSPSTERHHYKYCGTWQNTDPSSLGYAQLTDALAPLLRTMYP